jgi:hypothetical protein
LATTAADRVLRVLPQIEGSKATHQSSPRRGGLSALIGNVTGKVVDPFLRFAFVFFVRDHRTVALDELARGHMRPRKIIKEAADPRRPDDMMQAFIDLVADRDRRLFAMRKLRIRII